MVFEENLKGGVGGGEAEDAGEGGEAAEGGSFSSAREKDLFGFILFFGGAGGLRQVVDGFDGIDAGKVDGDVAETEFFAESLGEGAVVNFGQRADADAGRIGSQGGAHAGDDGDPAGAEGGEEFDFRGQRIDGVDHQVRRSGEDLVQGVGMDEDPQGLNPAGEIDLGNPLVGDFGFGPAEGGMQGVKLAIEVAGPDFVEIDKPESTDAGPGQTFDGVAADGPETDDGDEGALKQLKALRADHAFDP